MTLGLQNLAYFENEGADDALLSRFVVWPDTTRRDTGAWRTVHRGAIVYSS